VVISIRVFYPKTLEKVGEARNQKKIRRCKKGLLILKYRTVLAHRRNLYRFIAHFLLVWLFLLHVPVVVHACSLSGKKQVAGNMACCSMKSKMARSGISSKTPPKSCHRPVAVHKHAPSGNQKELSLKRAACCTVELPQTDTDAGIFTQLSAKEITGTTATASLPTYHPVLPQEKPLFYVAARPPPDNRQALLCTFRN